MYELIVLNMRPLRVLLSLFFSIPIVRGHSGDDLKDPLPVELFWPPARTWDSGSDNTEPCGSLHLADARTEFPMRKCQTHVRNEYTDSNAVNGQIALTIQSDKVQRLEVSISVHNGKL